jgi:hypothetical protein
MFEAQGDEFVDIVQVRNGQGIFSKEIELEKNPEKNVYVWTRSGSEKLELIYGSEKESSQSGKA